MKVVVAAALALTLATACSDSNGISTVPTPTQSSVPVSPTPTTASTRDAVREAARNFYVEASRAMSSGDVTRLITLITPDCSCQQLVRFIRVKWSHGSIRGGQFVVQDVGEPSIDGPIVVPVRRSTTAYEILDRSGKVIERGPADPIIREDLYLTNVDGAWKIKNVVVPR